MDPARSIVGLNYFGSCAGGRDVSVASDYAGTATAAVLDHASAALSWRLKLGASRAAVRSTPSVK